MRDRRDDADLRIGPPHAFDPGALPELRALAVGRHKKTRFDLPALRESRYQREWSRCKIGDRIWCDHFDRFFSAHGSSKHAAKSVGLHNVGGCLASPELVIKAEKMRSEIGVQRAVGDLDRRDGWGARRERIPQPEHRKEPLGCRRKSKSARIFRPPAVYRWSLGVYERDAEALRRLFGESKS